MCVSAFGNWLDNGLIIETERKTLHSFLVYDIVLAYSEFLTTHFFLM